MKAYYCVGTHWDREWYEPFQEFRMWLVELIDELMDLMDRDPEYKCFHLDGQAVVLQDYLEIRPERKEKLVEMLKSGQLLAGPWYDLPDEWLISGESYVRNVMMGMKVCRSMGVEPMPFAYTPDQFGHIAALPMIMTGFGLKAGICWRGTQDETYPAHFIWVGPDGSKMVTCKLRDPGSYAPFDFGFRSKLKAEGYPEEKVKEYFDAYLETEAVRSPAPVLLMLDAIDHQASDPKMSWVMQKLREARPDVEFHWTSLAELGAEMVKHADLFPERKGELREPCRDHTRVGQYLIVHTISSRYPVKQRNDQCQAALEKWAEPVALFQMMAGGQPILSYLDKAWEYLLRNHPHDSICGCSIDQVHRDMRYRFDQAEMIADGVTRRAITQLGNANETLGHGITMAVHNPLPFARTEVVEVVIPFAHDWPKRYIDGLATSELYNRFVLLDAAGKRLPFQIRRVERSGEQKVLKANGRKSTQVCDLYYVAVELALPPCGYTGFRVELTDEGTRNFGSLMSGALSAANGNVSLEIKPDGTARLEAHGRVFDGLFQYEDAGDCGDGWTYGRLLNDIVYRTPGTRVTTGIEEDGPLRTVFRVEREFELPRMMDRKTYYRSDDRTTLRVTDYIHVEKGVPFIRVRTRVKNTCMDHRLRVLFPTFAETDKSFAETPFALVERDIPVPPETANWQERINTEKAFTSFFGVQDKKGGLAVLAPFGLHEYEVLQTPDRSLALTLFRSTFKTVATAGEPDGELLGDMDFEYLLYPFSGAFSPVDALRHVACAQTGVRTHVAAEMPKERSFLKQVNGTAVVTAIKPAANGQAGIIRLWNPTQQEAAETLSFGVDIKSVEVCDLNEQPVSQLKANGNDINAKVPACGLLTLRVTW